ncbi:MAG: hypothetical protein K2Q24_01310 [Chitinophagaceae bacterium]|jgi:hypothetical protein|nr:hypothetical protein [Chitinophagaceae bacterium]
MKQLLISFLLLAGTGSTLHAQTTSFGAQTESIFNYPKPGSAKATFYFWYQKNNRVVLEMTDVRQLNLIPNLDSLVQEAFQSIKPLKDSFKSDGLVRRVDYVVSNTLPPQIRITTHPNKGESYSFYKSELVQTKIEKDTFRIKINTPSPRSKFKEDGVFYFGITNRPFVITILVDNFDDFTTFPANALEQCVNKVKADLGKNLTASKKTETNFRAYYNMQTGKMFSPMKPKYMGWGRRASFLPTIQFGIQYARGSFIPSAAAGLRYSFRDGDYADNYFSALWEPYFFFSRDANNKLITSRNDFITLKYTSIYLKRDNNKIRITDNVSIGYLIRKQGNWFEKNTFKVGIPGFLMGNLMFEPEFFFNDAFRNFSPSLKMTLLFD